MAKTRELVCKFYTYEGGPCDKRGISAHFNDECQTCDKYCPRKGGKPRRTDNRRQKKDKIQKRELRDY